MRKSNKIYYFPGLISAIIIPILFWYYASQRVHPPYTVMDLGLPAKIKKGIKDSNSSFESFRNWNYKKIIVKPNTALQNQQYYVSELKKLQAKNEKETGIEFVIDDKNNYQDFIALMDAMKLADQENYGVDVEKTNHFFAIHEYNAPNAIEKKYDGITGCVVWQYFKYKESYTGFERIKYLLDLPKQAYYIIFGFLLFMNISMLSIKERFQINRKIFI
ncbi:hypothetical protein [Chryseobacterium sp. G0201]|uniref:hypothetical protein n=1 Tax=Chryseobacterium sp. G0201 TaxID=2487065 RepID=UPI000F4DDACF|nr:hypothetical protein [Chryseobacterium sp. G0201]AZA54132.1 hypothetical protein EG348_14565 [Chryseobacterium sp. G0201]